MERDLDVAVLAGSVQKSLDMHINPRTVQESRDIDRLNNPMNRLDYRRWIQQPSAPSPSPYSNHPHHQNFYQPPPPPQQQPLDTSPYSMTLPSTPEGYIPLHGDVSKYANKYIGNNNIPSNEPPTQNNNISFQNTGFNVPNLNDSNFNKKQDLDLKAEETIIDNLRREVLELKKINENMLKQIKGLNTKILKLSKLIETNLINSNEDQSISPQISS